MQPVCSSPKEGDPMNCIRDVVRLLPAVVGGLGLVSLLAVGCGGGPSEGSGEAGSPADATDAGMADVAPDVSAADGHADGGPDADGGGFEDLPPHERYFEALRRAHDLFEGSSDSLPARAQELVDATGDPEISRREAAAALFEFVRDEIAAVPNDGPSYANLATRARWGPRATLYSGMGTPREKVDLLTLLYQVAEWDARTIGPWAPSGSTDELIDEMFGRPIEHVSDIELEESSYEQWSSAFRPAPELVEEQGDGDPDRFHGDRFSFDNRRSRVEERADEHETKTDELVGELLAVLPDEFGAESAPEVDQLELPLVELQLDGETHVLNPLDPNAEFDASWEGPTPGDVPAPEGLIPIEVAVELATADDPEEWITAVEGEWNGPDLAGRRLELTFASHLDFQHAATTHLRDIRTVVPVMTARGDALSDEQQEEMTAVGDPLTMDGRPIEEDGSDFRVGDRRLEGEPAEVSAADIAELDVRVDARNFPCVRTDVEATNAAGDSLAGLPGSAFEVSDTGEPRGARLESNVAPAPKVLFVIDTSTSVPEEFRSQETIDFLVTLADETDMDFPRAEYAIAQHSEVPDPGEEIWTDSLTELEQQGDDAVDTWPDGSPLWESIARGNELEPTVIVFVSDADPTDEMTDEKRRAIRDGVPTIVIGVGPLAEDNADLMARLSGGHVAEAREVDEIRPPLFEVLERHDTYNYRFRHTVPIEGPDRREVRVGVPESGVEATAQYDVPDSPDVSNCPMPFARLRTTVRVGDREVTRHLAGARRADEIDFDETAFADDVLTTLFGTITYAFDAGKPPLGTWGADYVESLLSGEERIDGLHGDGAKAIFEAFSESRGTPMHPAPHIADPMIGERTADGTRTYPTGLRTSLTVERFDPSANAKRLAFDILPLAGLETAVVPRASDELDAAEATLERSIGVAVAEGEAFSSDEFTEEGEPIATSTIDLLDGEELTVLPPESRRDFTYTFPLLTESERERWERLTDFYGEQWYLAVPADGRPFSFFAIHAETGESYAVMPDGTGGGTAAATKGCQRSKTLDMLGVQLGIMSLSAPNLNPAFSIIAARLQWVGKMFNVATAAVEWARNFESGDEIPDWLKNLQINALRSYACTMLKTAAGIEGGPLVSGALVANDIVGLFGGGGGPASCPTSFGLCDAAGID